MQNIEAIVTDIEGTTTDIAFVHETLFPYAANRLPVWLRSQADHADVASLIQATRKEAQEPDASIDRVIDILLTWIREDRKATPLKSLQGLIWRHGYEAGDFQGHVYPDVPEKLKAWKDRGLALYVYSSGSEAAQKLIFGYSTAGDLTPLFSGYFDTRIGAKKEPDSYQAISTALDRDPDSILFLSDVEEELAAAATAGMRTCLLLRDETTQTVETDHGVAHNFHEVAQLFELP